MTPSVPAPAGEAPDPLATYATAPEWLDDARQAMQALYGAAAGHPNADVIERNVARINEALKRANRVASGAPGRDAPSEGTIYPRGPLARELSQLAETLGDAVASVTNLGVSAKRIPRESVGNIRKVWLRLVEIVTELESGASRGLPAPPEAIRKFLATWDAVSDIHFFDRELVAAVREFRDAVGEGWGGLPAAPPDGPLSVAQLANILNTQGSPISAGASVGPVNERGWFIGESDLRYLIYALPRVARTALGEGRPE